MERNIQFISDSYLCTNCGACSAICAKKAISFQWSPMGRMYAQIDKKNCIDCGLCTKVCPSIIEPSSDEYPDRFVGHIKKLYVGRAINETIFRNAQSGGVCTALLAYLFDKKKIDCAVVCQMTAGDPIPEVNAKLITKKSELLKSQKSCYTPVEMLSILRLTHSFDSVAFVGLPCHIEGLTNLQRQSLKFLNIKYKIGLICDRTMCRTVMDVFATYTKHKPIKIDWRRKYDPLTGFHYENAPVVVYSGKDEERIPNKHRFLMKEFFTSPRCRVCYDKLNIMSDITLGDPWRMPNVELNEGASVIISRSEEGQTILEQAKSDGILDIYPHNLEEIITGQLINDRRESVPIYAGVMKLLFPLCQSFILSDTHLVTGEETKHIKMFIERDTHSKDEIIKTALSNIVSIDKPLSTKQRIIYKLQSILKSFIKNENSFIWC